MEVNNPMMDQLLVNTAAQAPANQSAKTPKDVEQSDFNSMVHQKRSVSEKGEAKAPKVETKPANGETQTEQKPVADEQYAIAAAMMFQAQPDARYTALQTEAAPELVAGTVETADAGAVVELPGTPVAEEIPGGIAETEPETAEMPATTETTVEATGTPVQREAPAEARHERPVEARPDAPRGTESERPEQPMGRTPRMAQTEAPRETEDASELPRAMRSEERPETEDDADTDTAQAMQERPLFERVDAPVIKVAEAPGPVPLETEDGVEQLGNELGDIVVNSVDANRVEVTLTPESLGKLTVEITRGTDGTLNVVLHATTERAANLLEKGMDGLRQALAQNAEREVQIQVRGNEESQQQFLNPDGRNDQNRQQQQQQQGERRHEQHSAQDFLQQLRLGLVDVDGSNE